MAAILRASIWCRSTGSSTPGFGWSVWSPGWAARQQTQPTRLGTGGKSRPKLGGDGLLQRRLIVLHDEQVISALVPHLLANLALAEHRVARHDTPLEDQT